MKNDLARIKSKKIKIVVLILNITYKHERILDSNKGRI